MKLEQEISILKDLLTRCIDRTRALYPLTLADGAPGLTGLVLDLRDRRARAIARLSGRVTDVYTRIELARRTGEMPTLTWHLPPPLVEGLLAAVDMPEIAEVVAQTPPDEFAVVVVSSSEAVVVRVPSADVAAG